MACEAVASEGCVGPQGVGHHAVNSVNVRWGTCDGTCNLDRSLRMTTSDLLGPGVITRLVDESRARGRWAGCALHCDTLSTDVLRTERSFCTTSVGLELGSARMIIASVARCGPTHSDTGCVTRQLRQRITRDSTSSHLHRTRAPPHRTVISRAPS
jgi:hypothetical protein